MCVVLVRDVTLGPNTPPPHPSGFCYVSFKREDSAEIAVKKTGKLQVKARPVLVDYETGQAKMGFKKNGGGGGSGAAAGGGGFKRSK